MVTTEKRTVLVGVVGMSPAVLTETVWALAQETPPVIPDEVVAITTEKGHRIIREQLFGKTEEWAVLCKKLGSLAEGKLCFGAASSIQVIGDGNHDFFDIASPQENEKTADFILKTVRQYTEDPSISVIASIAGGRKTMSALMLSCMTLLGREQDRVCHVLVNDDYFQEHPEFLFPSTQKEAQKAKIQLSDIPFVRVRGLYEKELGHAPTAYSDLVRQFQSATPPAINYPQIEIDKIGGKIYADGEDLRLSPKEFLLVFVLCTQFHKEGKPFANWEDVTFEIEDEMKKEYPLAAIWQEQILNTNYRSVDQWRKVASDMRKSRLKNRSWNTALIPYTGSASMYPPTKICILPTSEDIPNPSFPQEMR